VIRGCRCLILTARKEGNRPNSAGPGAHYAVPGDIAGRDSGRAGDLDLLLAVLKGGTFALDRFE
jgi:hypothetical protein